MRPLHLAVPALLLLATPFAAAAAAPASTPVSHVSSAPHSVTKSTLPWIEDDYAAAIARGRAEHRPVFVEVWAPWCHTCRSMKAYVFTDASLQRHAKDVVWLDIDSENPRNAAFRKKYPCEVLPSMFVIDPVREQATLRWIGGATVAQLHTLLDDVHAGGGTPPALLAQVTFADSTFGTGNNASATKAYEAVLAAAPADWRGRERIVESLMYAYSRTHQDKEAVALARQRVPEFGRTLSAMNVASLGLDAAVALADSVPTPEQAAVIRELVSAGTALVRDTSFVAAADDRSGEFISLLGAADAFHDDAAHKAVASEWATYLEGQAARARTPDQRAVFDPHRFSAYLELGQPERAIPMLMASERDMPDDYNPPARLANTYKALKRWDDALAASDRAMSKSYGPRRLLIYQSRADIYEGKGDKATARRTIEEAIAYAEALPESQRSATTLASLRKRLASMATS
jgi:tetratricopeptide (TPR) repeat protein/thiol-disulfide isomerase/thioredoxin